MRMKASLLLECFNYRQLKYCRQGSYMSEQIIDLIFSLFIFVTSMIGGTLFLGSLDEMWFLKELN